MHFITELCPSALPTCALGPELRLRGYPGGCQLYVYAPWSSEKGGLGGVDAGEGAHTLTNRMKMRVSGVWSSDSGSISIAGTVGMPDGDSKLVDRSLIY